MSTRGRYRTSHVMDPAARQKYRQQYKRRLTVMSDEEGLREMLRRYLALPAPLEALQLETYRWLS